MENLFWFFGAIGRGLAKYKHILPESFVIIFSLVHAIIIGFHEGFRAGFTEFVKQIFAAEFIIHQNVQLAVANDPSYSFFAFMAILNGVLVMYVVTKLISKYIIMGITGGTAPVSSFFVSILIVGVLEMAAIGYLEHVFFIPIYDGLIYLMFNLHPVFTNIHWLSGYVPNAPTFSENMSVNATHIENLTQ